MRSGRALNDPQIERLTLRFYALALLLVSMSFALRAALLLYTAQRDPVNDLILPLLAVGFGVSAWMAFRRKQVDILAMAAYVGGAVLVLVRLFFIWHHPELLPEPLSPVESLARFSHWLPGVYVLGFLAFDFRLALRLNLALYGCVIGLGLSYAVPQALGGHDLDSLQVVLHHAGADAVLIVIVYALVRINEAYEQVSMQAAETDHALQVARETNRARNQFLSRMSHEFRTPLNAILGFAQLLEMADLPDKQRLRVQQVLNAGRHLLDLVDEVLDVSRIDQGRLKLAPEAVEVRELLEEACDLIGPLAESKHVAVELDGEWDGIRVWADRQRLKQVVLNLLSNAVKFNRDGGVVTVSRSGGAEALQILVRDTGPGIAPDLLSHLFSPFERLGADQRGIEGTGLGLALTKRLIETMGGVIGVQSAVGAGSTFWIELPLLAHRQDPGVPPALTSDREAPARAIAEPTRFVLYVDDNPSNLSLVKQMLAGRPDLRILPAGDGQSGLDIARAHRPHLILLDLHLPDMNGEEVLQRLQADPETRRIPVIVVSADSSTARHQQVLAMGARRCLSKPLRAKEILNAVDHEIRERDVARL